jgi:signal transduction histidine kinase
MRDRPGRRGERRLDESDAGDTARDQAASGASVVRMLASILAGSLLTGAAAWAVVSFGPPVVGPVVGVGLGAAVGGGLGAVTYILTDPNPARDGVETVSVSMDDAPDDEAKTVDSVAPSRPTDERDFFAIHPDPVLYFEGEGTDVQARDANEAFEATFGASPSMLAGTPLDEATMAAGDVDVTSHVASGQPVDETVTCETVSGTARFRIRTVRTDETAGYLLYTPLPDSDDDYNRVEELASVLNHELNNPLDSARARIEVARDTGADEHFETAIRNLDRMRRIVDDLTTLAREGGVAEHTDVVDLDGTVRTAWEHVDAPGATLARTADLGAIRADGSAVERLFENLFRNAVEHVDGPVTVTVGPVDSGGFYVADDGPGIPEDDCDAVFEAGYTTDPDGTGLGLRIVERVAVAHDWTVRVEEADTGGARFLVEDVDELA